MSVDARVEVIAADEWRQLARARADYNYRQAVEFSTACAARLGASTECIAIRCGGEPLGVAHVRIKRLPIIGAGVAYINGGPLVRYEAAPADQLRACLAALRTEYVDRRGLILRVAPPLGPDEWNTEVAGAFAAARFVPARDVRRYRTLVVDLTPPLDELRKGLDQKWRNGLNRAERNGLAVRQGVEPELFESFCGMYDELRGRKAFDVELDARFHAAVQRALPPEDRFAVTIAEWSGAPVAGHVASLLGDTCVYLLGAATKAGLEQKASYVLQWHVLRLARERGCRAYDLGGIDPDGNPGVYHFKSGLGGREVLAPGPFEAYPRGLARYAVHTSERAYRWARRVMAGRTAVSAAAVGRKGAGA